MPVAFKTWWGHQYMVGIFAPPTRGTRLEFWPGLCNIQAWQHIIFYSTVWLAFSLPDIDLLAFCVLRVKVRSDLLSVTL